MTEPSDDRRRRAPAAGRNREPIMEVLRTRLPARGTVLELASGTGEHAVFLAHHLARLTWQPSDRDPEMLASIEAWRRQPGFRPGPVPNLLPPLELDVSAPGWPAAAAAAARFPIALVCINLLHVAPWETAQSLFVGAGELLMAGRLLFLYGPFKVEGRHTSLGNAAFDRSLRKENEQWGLRDLEAVQGLGEANRLDLEEVIEMPANNLALVFRRR